MKALTPFFLVIFFSTQVFAQEFVRAERLKAGFFTVVCENKGKAWTEVVTDEEFLQGKYCDVNKIKISSGVYRNQNSKCNVTISTYYQAAQLQTVKLIDDEKCLGLKIEEQALGCQAEQCRSKVNEQKVSLTVTDFGALTIETDKSTNKKFVYNVALSNDFIGGHAVSFIKPKTTVGVIGSDVRIIKETTHGEILIPLGKRLNVKFTNAFAIQKNPITQKIWTAIMGFKFTSNYGDNKIICEATKEGLSSCPDRPIHGLRWADAINFIDAINHSNNLECGDQQTDKGFLKAVQTPGCFRLPTEAEWEFMARAGVKTPYPLGVKPSESRDYDCRSPSRTNDEKRSHLGYPRDITELPYENDWGMANFIGGTMEYVQDVYHLRYGLNKEELAKTQVNHLFTKNKKMKLDKLPSTSGIHNRVGRGGGYYSDVEYCSLSARTQVYEQSNIRYAGFRLARSL